MWSIAALAAEAALDAPRASMIAAPRCWTLGMNVSSSHVWSPMTSAAERAPTRHRNRSGYWVAEWFPQIVMRDTSLTDTPARAATWVRARL